MSALVEFAAVGFAYPRPPRPEIARDGGFALADVSFAIEAGEVFGVIGPNSAGKTTLLRLLTRVVAAERGEVRLDGRPLARLAHAELARRIAVVPQDAPRPFPFSVEQLSGGERQRAMLARALAQQPTLLVLDEPTSHLDLRYQAETAALIRRVNAERGMTVLLVSHDLNLAAEVSDRLLLLARGRVARLGTPAEVLRRETLEAVFGCAVSVDVNPSSGRPVVQVAWPQEVENAGRAH